MSCGTTDPPLGPLTDEIVAAWDARDWDVLDAEDGLIAFHFGGSFGGRLEKQAHSVWELGGAGLECEVIRTDDGFVAKVTTCGVADGCRTHRSVVMSAAVGEDFLPADIAILEFEASMTKLADIAACLLGGPCGSSDPRNT